MHFVYPVAFESISSVILNMVYSSIIGTISTSALSAISTAGQVVNFYGAAFSLLSLGGTVLTARMVGAGDKAEASRTIEQSLLLTLIFSGIVTLISMLFAHPIMKMLMPTVEAQLLNEAVVYFRASAIGLPFLYVMTMLTGVMRASGNSKAPFATTVVMYILLIIFAYFFVKVLGLEVIGAAYALTLFRIAGCVMITVITLRSHANFYIRIRNIFKPHKETISRMIKLGIPACAESCFVQFGYLLANSLTLGLGTYQAAVYNVANTLQGFCNTPNGICSSVASTFVGQYLGAGKHAEAKRFGLKTLAIGIPVILLLYVIMGIISPWLAPLYTPDAEIASDAVKCLWILMLFAIPAQSINTIDPALRAGGDVKFVLFETVIGVWLVRLPLSWLFAYKFNWGVIGIYLANIISLYVRAGCGLFRYLTDKWMYKRV